MATYYNQNNNNSNNNNTEIQGGSSDDGLQTLLLMNPISPYHHLNNNNNNNLVFLNPTQQQHLVRIPQDGISALHHSFMPCQQGPLSLTLSASPNKHNFGVNGTRKDVVLGSRYLKVAQELLDEVVSVGREMVRNKVVREESAVTGEKGSGGERGGEMSAADRQDIQIRKAKLIGMLDEVEQRYRQYHHQMQIVISWFEQATGTGSAKTYTALALETISKQSRCLKDAITSQIRASNKSLGEEDDSFSGGKNEGSRLKFVDNQIKQQRALQQLGMIQPNAWRPQRGLPEGSVSVLRAWLFEHFLHPYPKDSDKIMLAKQTGLTRSQVSNWFINARVRLWKPMVEEMYIEEIKDQEQNETKYENYTEEGSASKTKTLQEQIQATRNENMNFKSVLDTPTNQNSPPVVSASTIIRSLDRESFAQASPKKQRNMDLLRSNNSYLPNEQNLMTFGNLGGPTNFIGGFGAEQYPSAYSTNAVSLTLGLPHRENLSLTSNNFLHNQNIEMGRRLEIDEPDEFDTINNTSNSSQSSVVYESLNIQNRKRFAAQLLPDFVT